MSISRRQILASIGSLFAAIASQKVVPSQAEPSQALPAAPLWDRTDFERQDASWKEGG